MFDPDRFITDRVRAIDASGVRRAFDLAAGLDNPLNLSIGQPDFDVPEPVRQAATSAIEQGQNRYTPTQGIAALRQRVVRRLRDEFPHTLGAGAAGSDGELRSDLGLLITSGVSGGLMLSLLSTVGPGDEVLVPDPYFVMYKHLVTLTGATPVYVDTYPDFQLTPERVEAHLTERSKVLLFNSPSNPTGVVADDACCRGLVELAERENLLLISDEIYDEFCYEKAEYEDASIGPVCPSPAAHSPNLLVMRGFSKTYAMTGWRLGYVVGPQAILSEMTKLQQYSFVCAPSMVQIAGVEAMDVDMSHHVAAYQRKRDRVVERLSPHYELTVPQGAFYAFPKIPERLKLSGNAFIEKAIEKNLIIIPGNVFSERDTHFRLSYACDKATLEKGLDALVELAESA